MKRWIILAISVLYACVANAQEPAHYPQPQSQRKNNSQLPPPNTYLCIHSCCKTATHEKKNGQLQQVLQQKAK